MRREDIEKIFKGLYGKDNPERMKLAEQIKDCDDDEAAEVVVRARETIKSIKPDGGWHEARAHGVWGAVKALGLLQLRALPAVPELAALDEEFQRHGTTYRGGLPHDHDSEGRLELVLDVVESLALAACEAERLDVFLSPNQLAALEKAAASAPAPPPAQAPAVTPAPSPGSSGPAGLAQFLASSRQQNERPPSPPKPAIASRAGLTGSAQTEMMKLVMSWARKNRDPEFADYWELLDPERVSTALRILAALGPAAVPFIGVLQAKLESEKHWKLATMGLLTIGPEGHDVLRKYAASKFGELQNPRSPAALAQTIRYFKQLRSGAFPHLWDAIGIAEHQLADEVNAAKEKLMSEIVRNIDVLKTVEGGDFTYIFEGDELKRLAEQLSLDQIRRLSHAGFPLNVESLARMRPDVFWYSDVGDLAWRDLERRRGWDLSIVHSSKSARLVENLKSVQGDLGAEFDFAIPYLMHEKDGKGVPELIRRIWPFGSPIQLAVLQPFLETKFEGDGTEFKNLRAATVPDHELLKKWLNAANREGQMVGALAAAWLRQEVPELLRLIGPEYHLKVRAHAAKALGLIGGPGPERGLLDTLQETRRQQADLMRDMVKLQPDCLEYGHLKTDLGQLQSLRRETILALGYLGAKGAFHPLMELIEDRAERELCGYWKIAGGEIDLEDRLKPPLDAAFSALCRIDSKSKDAVAKIVGLVRQERWEPVFDSPLLKRIGAYHDRCENREHGSYERYDVAYHRSIFLREAVSAHLIPALSHFDPVVVLKHRRTLDTFAETTRNPHLRSDMDSFFKQLEKKAGWGGWFT
jgi:hypothetical protein